MGKTKVKFSERKIYEPNIYHVYLEFENNERKFLSEIGKNGNILQVEKEEINHYILPNVSQSIEEIKELEKIHNKSYYIFGVNDCRHFCNRMLDSLYEFEIYECDVIIDNMKLN